MSRHHQLFTPRKCPSTVFSQLLQPVNVLITDSLPRRLNYKRLLIALSGMPIRFRQILFILSRPCSTERLVQSVSASARSGRVLPHRHSLKRYLEFPDIPGLMAYRSPASGYCINSESVIAKRAVVMNNVPSCSTEAAAGRTRNRHCHVIAQIPVPVIA